MGEATLGNTISLLELWRALQEFQSWMSCQQFSKNRLKVILQQQQIHTLDKIQGKTTSKRYNPTCEIASKLRKIQNKDNRKKTCLGLLSR